jgi:hypothetical protein
VSVPNDNWCSLVILGSRNINTLFIFLEVAEMFISIGKELPPVGVGAPDLEVLGST